MTVVVSTLRAMAYPFNTRRARYPQSIGAMRDQFGNVMHTGPKIPQGQLSTDHDWSAFDSFFNRSRPAPPPPVAAAPLVKQDVANDVGAALEGAGAVPGMQIAGAAMQAAAPAMPKIVSRPPATTVSATNPATRTTLDGRTEYLDPVSGRYVQSTGSTPAGAPPRTGRAPLINPTRDVFMKPIPMPTINKDGTKSNIPTLAQNAALYAPGGAFETADQREARRAAAVAPDPNVSTYAGTGISIPSKYTAHGGYAFSAPAGSTSATGSAAPVIGNPVAPVATAPSPAPAAASASPAAPAAPTPQANTQPITPTAPVASSDQTDLQKRLDRQRAFEKSYKFPR